MKTAINYDLGELRKLVQRWPDETREEMRVTMDRIVRRLEAEVVKRTPAGVGGQAGLRGSIAGEVATLGRTVTGTVGTPLEYGEVVELGRRPGKAFPPVDPIALWARRKLGVSEKESRSVGFAIARKIAIHGFEGAHMFEEGWKHIEPWAQKELMGIGERVVRRVEA
jgi:hypothetical protein